MTAGHSAQTKEPVSAVDPSVAAIREAVEARLVELAAAPPGTPGNLEGAIAYALLGKSKRVRPVLLYLVAEPSAADSKAAIDLGCAVEMVHTASLILDDLPCMDDAQLRRNRPTTHLAFGQPTAILSAIALLTQAFGLIAGLEAVPAPVRTRLTGLLSEAVGPAGLTAGQEIDVNSRASLQEAQDVERLNWLKTGVLFVAAAEMGAHLRGLTEERVEDVRLFARHFGLAFQTADDLLDRDGSTDQAGKDLGKDGEKATLVSLFGASKARLTCQEHLAKAEEALLRSGVTPQPVREMMSMLFGMQTADLAQ